MGMMTVPTSQGAGESMVRPAGKAPINSASLVALAAEAGVGSLSSAMSTSYEPGWVPRRPSSPDEAWWGNKWGPLVAAEMSQWEQEWVVWMDIS